MSSPTGMKGLLANYKLGVAEMRASQLVLTSMGRRQRRSGINLLKIEIKQEGFLENYAPLVVVESQPPDDVDLQEAVLQPGFTARVLDGNHRVSAQQELDKEADPVVDSKIPVIVYREMPAGTERVLALGMNRSASTLVERLVVDNIEWYRQEVRMIQQESSVSLSENQLAGKVKARFDQIGQTPPTRPTIVKYLKMALGVTDIGLAAMLDVTHLDGRPEGHPDFKLYDYKRLTVKMLNRPQFLGMVGEEQEVYIRRLARGAAKGQIPTEEETERIDQDSRRIGGEVTRVHAICPRDQWSPTFKLFMMKVIVKDNSSKFAVHEDALGRQVRAYEDGLEVGMAASKPHTDMIRAQPHANTIKALREDAAMAGFFDTYNNSRTAMHQKASSDRTKFLADATTRASEAAAALASKAGGAAANTTNTPVVPAGTNSTGQTPAAGGAGPSTTPASTAPSRSTVTPAVTSDKTNTSTGSGKRKRSTAAPRISPAAAGNAERLQKLRDAVATVKAVDILSSSWDTGKGLPDEADSVMLVFLNVGMDPSVLVPEDGGTPRLRTILTELAGVLHPRGTLILAMEGSMYDAPDLPYIRRLATEVDLVVEKTLVLTAYLAGQPGRISADFKNHYSPQSAAAIVMHAGKDFSVYGPAAGGRRAMRGAQSDIEKYDNIGVILAPKFPDTKTYLSPSTANHFLKRFTVAGDKVMVTAADENNLASLVLESGRHLTALVSDESKVDNVQKEVGAACSSAMSRGWFAELSKGNVLVGNAVLPECLPPRIESAAVRDTYFEHRSSYDSEEEDAHEADAESALEAAKHYACDHGLEIKASDVHGVGLFAIKTLKVDEVVPMSVLGALEVLTNDEAVALMLEDGVPRYPMCDSVELSALLGTHETAAEGSRLWVKPDDSCFLYYVNSCGSTIEKENMIKSSVFQAKKPTVETAKTLLVDATNGVAFRPKREIQEGEELFVHYPFPQEVEGASGAGDESCLSPGRTRSSRRSRRTTTP